MQRSIRDRTQHIYMNRTFILLKSFKQIRKSSIIYMKIRVFIDKSVYRRYVSTDIDVTSICFALNQ
jgi:hypothetical protein